MARNADYWFRAEPSYEMLIYGYAVGFGAWLSGLTGLAMFF